MSERVLLSTKQLAGLLYSMGRTFDGLQSTFLATEEFLRTGNPHVVNSKADYNLLLDLRQAAEYTLHYDYAHKPIDLAYVKSINAQLTRTAAMEPGKLRDERIPVMVNTPLGRYEPPVPDSAAVASLIKSTVRRATGKNNLEEAVRLFAGLAKLQPFGDGNKRTALLAGNGLLIAHGGRYPLTVPTSDKDRTWFNQELAAYYLNNDQTIIRHLAKWNRQHALQVEDKDNRDDKPSFVPEQTLVTQADGPDL
ncbi:Fic family protein [Bifidobacterium choladohabitans]|uniref:Fic family protein n=1 Tax=Bifidobacterium choladohabitans TaxID=2750947 RepID=UPI001E39C533|nr:Fic family protein [Bifidobacterium choladohabitans]